MKRCLLEESAHSGKDDASVSGVSFSSSGTADRTEEFEGEAGPAIDATESIVLRSCKTGPRLCPRTRCEQLSAVYANRNTDLKHQVSGRRLRLQYGSTPSTSLRRVGT